MNMEPDARTEVSRRQSCFNQVRPMTFEEPREIPGTVRQFGQRKERGLITDELFKSTHSQNEAGQILIENQPDSLFAWQRTQSLFKQIEGVVGEGPMEMVWRTLEVLFERKDQLREAGLCPRNGQLKRSCKPLGFSSDWVRDRCRHGRFAGPWVSHQSDNGNDGYSRGLTYTRRPPTATDAIVRAGHGRAVAKEVPPQNAAGQDT